jgi:hypothetical protein
MTTSKYPEPQPSEPSPSESPFELPPIEGIPYSKDSDEADAIREVIEQADFERAGRTQD